MPVYDADRTEDGLFYIVSKFVAGGNLAGYLAQNRPEMAASATLVVRVAEALHHAHQRASDPLSRGRAGVALAGSDGSAAPRAGTASGKKVAVVLDQFELFA